MANIRVIPALAPIVSAQVKDTTVKRRVAAYARVSTDSDEQQNSYEAQVDYYTKLIHSRPDWSMLFACGDQRAVADCGSVRATLCALEIG